MSRVTWNSPVTQTIATEIAECEECKGCFLRYQEHAVKIAEFDGVPVHILKNIDPHGGHGWFIRVEDDPRPWPMDAVRVMTVVPFEDEDD